MEDVDKVLHEINLLCVTHNFTLILGWSEMEMARYIETFKVLQNRDASSIQKSKDSQMHHMSMVDQMVDVLLSTSKKGTKLNKTDAATLLTHFTSMQQIIQATPDELSLIPGLGPTKVQRLHDTFHLPFSTKLSRERQKRLQNKESTIDEVDDPIATASNTTTSKS
jgi:DNA excision repair protein ERCC-1